MRGAATRCALGQMPPSCAEAVSAALELRVEPCISGRCGLLIGMLLVGGVAALGSVYEAVCQAAQASYTFVQSILPTTIRW